MSDSAPSKATRPWYRLTADRFLVGILAAICLLFLADRFDVWGPKFGGGRGVLFAVALVAIAVLAGLLWYAASLLLRMRFQFGIRTLFLSMFVVAIVCSWFAVRMNYAKRQRKAVAAVESVGGRVAYLPQGFDVSGNVYEKVPGLAWLHRLVGTDFLVDVAIVSFETAPSQQRFPEADDDWLVRHIEGLPHVRWLDLEGTEVGDTGIELLGKLAELKALMLTGTRVTDTGAKRLGRLRNLEWLGIADTRISDTGLGDLAGLTNLTTLDMHGTQITDAGIKHLERLSNIQVLSLANTAVSDAGLAHLKGMPNLCAIDLDGTQVTGTGLEYLKGLAELEWLSLDNSQFNDAGLEHLKTLASLSQVSLRGTRITDAGLAHLEEMTGLIIVDLKETAVSDHGVEKLQQALPNCAIGYGPTTGVVEFCDRLAIGRQQVRNQPRRGDSQ